MKLHPDVTNKITIRRFQTLEEDFNKLHNNKFDYSEVIYINNKTKIKIICPIHGEFEQVPQMHLRGSGCIKCSRLASKTSSKKTKTTEQFIEEAKKIHKGKYIYSETNYINMNTKLTIICPEHGKFEQRPDNHLSGKGCPRCCATGVKKTTEQFIEEANTKHNNKYDYSESEYINSKTKIKIICPKHGEFEQITSQHLGGSGCPKCNCNNGAGIETFRGKNTLFYYIYLLDFDMYKLGITTFSVKERYKYEGINYKILFTEMFHQSGEIAFDIEQSIKDETEHLRPNENLKIFESTKNTEVTTKNVLPLIKKKIKIAKENYEKMFTDYHTDILF